MAQNKLLCVALVAALCVMVTAQQQEQSCATVSGMANLNSTMLNGTWYELVQAPAPTVGCVMTNIAVAKNASFFNLVTSYSSSSSSKYMDKHENAMANITEVNTNAGFNLTLSGNTSSPLTYKILDTDYISYIAVCGYSQANSQISFGALFGKTVSDNSTWVNEVVGNVSRILSSFNSTTVKNVTQAGCYASSASTSVPYLTSVFAVLLLIAKFLN